VPPAASFWFRLEVKKVDGNLKLWQPKIREIDEPDDLWFYE
jgi:hypothetical protein